MVSFSNRHGPWRPLCLPPVRPSVLRPRPVGQSVEFVAIDVKANIAISLCVCVRVCRCVCLFVCVCESSLLLPVAEGRVQRVGLALVVAATRMRSERKTETCWTRHVSCCHTLHALAATWGKCGWQRAAPAAAKRPRGNCSSHSTFAFGLPPALFYFFFSEAQRQTRYLPLCLCVCMCACVCVCVDSRL